MTYAEIDSPVGSLLLAADAEGLRVLSFVRTDRPVKVDPAWTKDRGALDEKPAIRIFHCLHEAAQLATLDAGVGQGLRGLGFDPGQVR